MEQSADDGAPQLRKRKREQSPSSADEYDYSSDDDGVAGTTLTTSSETTKRDVVCYVCNLRVTISRYVCHLRIEHGISKSSADACGWIKKYTPPEFTKEYDNIWAEYASHIRRRCYKPVKNVEDSVSRRINEVILMLQLVDPQGDLVQMFKTNAGERFEKQAFAVVTQELRTTTRSASTWANRMRSLIHFMDYLTVYQKGAGNSIDLEEVENVLARAREFKQFAEKAKQERTNTLRLTQSSQDIGRKKTVNDLRSECDFALQNYQAVKARNLLMTLMVDRNSSRPGPLINMTLKEYESMQHQESKSVWVIHVATHKTAAQFGPASVFFSEKDRDLMRRFVIDARPLLSISAEPGDPVFVTKRGRKLSTSEFCKVQKHLIGYTTTYKRKKDSVLFRNSASEPQVSELMLHSRATHRRNYSGTATMEDRMAGFLTINQTTVTDINGNYINETTPDTTSTSQPPLEARVSSTVNAISCPQCGRECKSKAGLGSHLRTHKH